MVEEQLLQSDGSQTPINPTKELDTFPKEYRDFLGDLGFTFFDVPPHDDLEHMVQILNKSKLWDMGDAWKVINSEEGRGRRKDLLNQQPSQGRTIAFRPADVIEGKISEVELKKRLEKIGTILSTQMGNSKAVRFDLPTQAEALLILDKLPDDLRSSILSRLSYTIPTADVFSVNLAAMGISEEAVHPRKRSQYTIPFRSILTDINVPQRSLRVGVVDARSEAMVQTGVLPILVARS